ncbi:MAG TPA: YceI family protein [Burkholderiaceae bacterium]|nr:YceI family protein [Burkholderiaceae bacterium]
MRTSFFAPLALVAAVGFAGATQAATYTTLDPEASSLAFGYSQMNVKMDGSFGELQAPELQFDPAAPESAKVRIEVALASIDAGYPDANAELKKDEWLAMNQHPVATFTSSAVKSIGDGRYEVTGELSVKGNSRPVTVPFSFKEEAGKGVFEGSFPLQRADFGIGEGQWKDFSIVANEIEVSFKFVATP